MGSLIFVTQVMDPDDPVLGFVVEWVRALAARCDRFVVVVNEARVVPEDLGCEVVSLGKERGKGRVLRASRYGRSIFELSRRIRADALIAHMCPKYLNLAAPITKSLRVRSLLWFAHPSRGPTLRLAERLSDLILTSFPGSYPRLNPKVRVIGQAIDVEKFSYQPLTPRQPLELLALGRTSPIKNFGVAIRAMELLRSNGVAARLRIVGPSTTDAEARHRRELVCAIRDLRLGKIVTLEEGVTPARVPRLLADCDVLVNSVASGSGDKVVLEAMATGRIPLVSNRAFVGVLANLPLTLTFEEGDPADLAAKIKAVACADLAVRERVGRELRWRVQTEHSLERWADRVVDAALSRL